MDVSSLPAQMLEVEGPEEISAAEEIQDDQAIEGGPRAELEEPTEISESSSAVADSTAGSAEEGAPVVQPFSFGSLEPPPEAKLVSLRIEFAEERIERTEISDLESGALHEISDSSSPSVDEPGDFLEQVRILAGDRQIASGVIVIVNDCLSVKVTNLHA